MNGRDHVAEQQLTSLLKVFFTANKKSKNEWKRSSTRAANSWQGGIGVGHTIGLKV